MEGRPRVKEPGLLRATLSAIETESNSCHNAGLLRQECFVREPFSGVISYPHMANLYRKHDAAHLRALQGQHGSWPE